MASKASAVSGGTISRTTPRIVLRGADAELLGVEPAGQAGADESWHGGGGGDPAVAVLGREDVLAVVRRGHPRGDHHGGRCHAGRVADVLPDRVTAGALQVAGRGDPVERVGAVGAHMIEVVA